MRKITDQITKIDIPMARRPVRTVARDRSGDSLRRPARETGDDALLEGCPSTPGLTDAVLIIRGEQRRRGFDAIRSLWRLGDAVRRLRLVVGPGDWRRTLQTCANAAGMHPESLHDAARASAAFPPDEREPILARFDSSGASLTVSHVIALARATPSRRTSGVEALLRSSHSVRALRAHLNEAHGQRHGD
jgi:hypothetical protein